MDGQWIIREKASFPGINTAHWPENSFQMNAAALVVREERLTNAAAGQRELEDDSER